MPRSRAVLVLRFSAQDLARTRFATSPLLEVVTSVQALTDPGRHALHLPWVREAGNTLAANPGVRFDILSALVPNPAHYIPDFVTRIPAGASGDLEDDLASLLSTAPDSVRADLDRIAGPLPASLRALRRDPDEGLARLADEIREYWRLLLARHWPRIRRLHEGEILHRARIMAAGGAAELFGDLHPQVAWSDGVLRIAHKAYDGDRALDSGHGLVLLPTAFVWPGVFTQHNPPAQPGLIYPPRGVATLWERGTRRAPDALAKLLGATRALLLVEIGAPSSTTELSARTGIPSPTVSHHLTVLRDAGLAAAHRTGRVVLYQRTTTAEALVADGGMPDGG